jgi:predicted solute-binding protein
LGILNVHKLRISIVQYLNTAPLIWGFTNGPLQGKYDLSFTVPSQCAEALRSGAADIAIIPAIEYQRIDDLVVLPGMAIASRKQVRSLLLVSKKRIHDVESIALDSSSRSTQALTRILCVDSWKIAPDFFEASPDLSAMLAKADAALLIGDPALRLSISVATKSWAGPDGESICQGSTGGVANAEELHVYDMVEEWQRATGLPAVLAIWAAKRNVVTPEVLADFAASRDYGLARIAQISKQSSLEMNLPTALLSAYLTFNIDFSLSAANRQGLEHFYDRAAALELIPEAKPIDWAGTTSEVTQASAIL